MQLNVFNGHLGLPSIDIKSLQMIAYAKFMKMNIKIVKKTFKPYIGSELPELICENFSIKELEDYIEHLKFEAASNSKLNSDLMKLDKRYKPYEIMFQETLRPALMNTIWLDDKNYRERTRGIYAQISRFPLNYFVPNYLRNLAIDYVDSIYPPKNRKEFFDIELIEKAKEVLKLLSDKLADSKYFSDLTVPNELDALIFGYLAVISKLELPNLNNLQQFILEQKNLTKYVDRILNEYFPEQIELDKNKLNESKDLKIDNFEKSSWKSIFFVGLLAISSNLMYTLYMIGRNEDDSDDEDE